jgi:predicted ester cyclase
MTIEDNKAVVTRFYSQVINHRDLSAIDQLLAPDFLHNDEPRGASGQRQAIETLFAAMPDISVTTEAVIAEGDIVAVRQTWTGIQTGVFMGVSPSGRRLCFTSTAMLRVENGRIAAAWVNEDDLGLMRQLNGP